jgi:hypothetical protein
MPHTINPAIESFLNFKMSEQESRQNQIRVYRSYYEGDPPTLLTDRQAAFLNVDTDKNFGVNVCAPVVDVLSERLEVTGFSVQPKEESDERDTEADERVFAEWFNENRMDAAQNWVYQAALREAESFIIVGYSDDKERVTLSHDYAYDGTSGVKVHITPGTHREIAFASKRWQVNEETARMNLYYPNRIEKYINTADGAHSEAFWSPFLDPDDKTTQMVIITERGASYDAAVSWWTDDQTETGIPLGVPIIQFINRDDGTGRGLSEIDNAIPIQDAINKTVIDSITAADWTGFQMFWTDGKLPGNLQVYPGAMIPVSSNDGLEDKPPTVGVLPPGDMSGLMALINMLVSMLSGITGTPQSRFTPSAVRPSEGTQKQEESALVAKITNIHKVWGNAWEDVMRMASTIDAAFGKDAIKDIGAVTISTLWADPQTRNEKEHIESLAIKREKLDIPLTQIWREVPYDAAEIAEMKEEKEQERAEQLEEAAAERQANMTDLVLAMGTNRNANGSNNGEVPPPNDRGSPENAGATRPGQPDNRV